MRLLPPASAHTLASVKLLELAQDSCSKTVTPAEVTSFAEQGDFHNIFWTKCFTFQVTESGPESRAHWIPSLETEDNMLSYWRLKLLKMKLKKRILYQPMESRHVRYLFSLTSSLYGIVMIS